MALGARGALGARRCGDVARRFHRRRRVRALAARARARRCGARGVDRSIESQRG
jgi:hypothetical protein